MKHKLSLKKTARLAQSMGLTGSESLIVVGTKLAESLNVPAPRNQGQARKMLFEHQMAAEEAARPPQPQYGPEPSRYAHLTGAIPGNRPSPFDPSSKSGPVTIWKNPSQQHATFAKKAIKSTKPAMASADFYMSRPWRALRYQALKLHGARCQCCGASAEQGKVMHVDHIKPRSKHPQLELVLSNLQVLCEDCNLGKSNVDDTDWRPAQVTPQESEYLAEAFHRWMHNDTLG